MSISFQDINKFLQRTGGLKILVVGDLMLDEFIWGQVNRISPEAPVPVVHVTHESFYPGGAANVARNLADFGIQSVICGIIGADTTGKRLIELLKTSNIQTDGVLAVEGYTTTIKTRIIARHQQVVRVDREKKLEHSPGDFFKLFEKLEQIVPNVNGIIIEDYGKGFITQKLVDKVRALAIKHQKFLAADPNIKNTIDWTGISLLKPNHSEAVYLAGPETRADIPVEELGQRLVQKYQLPNLLITLGENGMMFFHPPNAPYHTPTRAREVFDVSGAGDTVIAFFTAAWAAGMEGVQAAEIANHAAGIVVGKLGTATLTAKELQESFARHD
ncbi:D-glycero-beta-D-manno-heptose-7-phosphate kinase [candidate division KSB1 bacterium]|nr:D-glycero-beta-D-manno-heptose-7-phosphate kinase [candidate division KSB1 bacterium]